jgi:hypothetical protein
MERQETGGLVIALTGDLEPGPEDIAFATSQAAIRGLVQALAPAFAARHERLEARCLRIAAPAAPAAEVAAGVLEIVAERITPPPAAGR